MPTCSISISTTTIATFAKKKHHREEITGDVLGNGSQNVSTTSNITIPSITPSGKRKRNFTSWDPTVTKLTPAPASMFNDNGRSDKSGNDGTATSNQQHTHYVIIDDDDSFRKTPSCNINGCDDETIESSLAKRKWESSWVVGWRGPSTEFSEPTQQLDANVDSMVSSSQPLILHEGVFRQESSSSIMT